MGVYMLVYFLYRAHRLPRYQFIYIECRLFFYSEVFKRPLYLVRFALNGVLLDMVSGDKEAGIEHFLKLS